MNLQLESTMDVTISARHTTVPATLHDHAERLARRLDRLAPKAATMAVSFETENGIRAAEARLTAAGGPPMIGHGTGPTYRNALNLAIDRIERQLKRRRQRRRQHRRAGVDV
jgi:ribosomal subunit interface protein